MRHNYSLLYPQSVVLKRLLGGVVVLIALAGYHQPAPAQQVQIPTLQVCNTGTVTASALVRIESRIDALNTGSVALKGKISCAPSLGAVYPTGIMSLLSLSMSDSALAGDINLVTFEQFTSSGKHTPHVWVNGRCEAKGVKGCHYWLMMVDNTNGQNGKTPDIVSFLVLNEAGKRVAYGTGPVIEGDIKIAPTGN